MLVVSVRGEKVVSGSVPSSGSVLIEGDLRGSRLARSQKRAAGDVFGEVGVDGRGGWCWSCSLGACGSAVGEASKPLMRGCW